VKWRSLAVLAAGGIFSAQAESPENAIPSAQLESAHGAALFAQRCAGCHEHPSGNIPPVFVLNYKSPEAIVEALTNGAMRAQASGLSTSDIRELAIHLAHRAPGKSREPDPAANLCRHPPAPMIARASNWNGVGASLANTRYQETPGIRSSEIPHLRLKWAFAYPGGAAYGQPVVVGDLLFVTSVTGRVFALNAISGCTYWSYKANAGVRTAVSVGVPPSSEASPLAYFGDEKGAVYALNARTGELRWKTAVDEHALVRITGSPVLYADTLFVPVSAMDEGAEWDRQHPCCTFRGSVVAVDAATGVIRWKTYMIPRTPAPLGRANEVGTPLSGPAGAAIWSAPTVDPQRGVLYVATGNAYNDVEEGDTNAVVALDLKTGERRWAVQPLPKDDPYAVCRQSRRGDCEKPAPERLEFGSSPVLRSLHGGGTVLVVGQKSGVIYGLDPDDSGTELWQTRVGAGGPLGGIMYGAAADEQSVYASVADRDAEPPSTPGGLSALRLSDGRQLWRAAAPRPVCSWGPEDCSAAQPGAVSAIPGAVFSGSLDGHIRAFSSATGAVIWDFDTAKNFRTINGVTGTGGAVNGYPQIIANGVLYVISGGSLLTHPGNVLLAFTVNGR
jgi:polyvinyl alcohol dehydrogenase (cytochrome)